MFAQKTGINHVQIATNMENAESFTIIVLFAYHKNKWWYPHRNEIFFRKTKNTENYVHFFLQKLLKPELRTRRNEVTPNMFGFYQTLIFTCLKTPTNIFLQKWHWVGLVYVWITKVWGILGLDLTRASTSGGRPKNKIYILNFPTFFGIYIWWHCFALPAEVANKLRFSLHMDYLVLF